MSQRLRALSLYGRLLRACDRTFVGDKPVVATARKKIRTHFEQSRDVTDEDQLNGLFQLGDETERYLVTSVVQARKQEETGRYKLAFEKHHTIPNPSPPETKTEQ